MARDQQFCLRWNNYQTNLGQVFEQLLHAELFVDVTLACEGNSIKAHRMILSACSPYFHTVLTDVPCSHPVIILQGVKWPELKAIVEFMYKGEINIGQDQLAPLLQVAESLKIRGLADVGGDEAEAVLTSPSESPRGSSNFWGDNPPKKKRKLSEEDRSPSRSRSPPSPPPPRPHTPTSATEVLETSLDIPITLSRGSSISNPPPSLPSPSPVASLATSLTSLAHLHGPMPPPGPPLPPHLAHLPPLSPLSPLLNMHPMSRHHSPEDFEIRPGIAEMIREEERVSEKMLLHHHMPLPDHRPFKFSRRRDMPDMAKLLESTHHWIGNPMADSYQAQVQAAWQKSWNQTQSLLQNLRFRERGPLKSWRPETMAEAIHAVLKEGLSLSQAARKYDIPYPTFVLYANRVHNLLGPSHEPGDLRPKGRGRPQRILLGSWPEDQIKGVIRAVVFRDTAVFRDGDHKENKQPTSQTSKVKEEAAAAAAATAAIPNGPFTPSSNGTSTGTPEGNTPSPFPPSTSSTSQPLPPGSSHTSPALASPMIPDGKAIPLPPPITKKEPLSGEGSNPIPVPPGPNSSSGSTTASASANCISPTSAPSSTPTSSAGSPKGVPIGPQTPQSRPSSTSSNSQQGSHSHVNGLTPNSLSHSNSTASAPSLPKVNGTSSSEPVVSSGSTNGSSSAPSANSQLPIGGMMHANPHNLMPKSHSNGQNSLQNQLPHPLHNHQPHPHSNAQMHHHQSQRNHAHSLFPQQQHHNQQTNHLQHSRGHGQGAIPPPMAPAHQQMLGLISGGLPSATLPASPVHMARLFGEGPPHLSQRPPPHAQPPLNTFHHGFPRAGHPTMQAMGMMNPMNPIAPRLNTDEPDLSPDAILFGKISSTADRHPFNSDGASRPSVNNHNQFDRADDETSSSVDRSLLFRDSLDTIKSEPEAIMN